MARLRRLPVLHEFPVDAVPRAPYPERLRAVLCDQARSGSGTRVPYLLDILICTESSSMLTIPYLRDP